MKEVLKKQMENIEKEAILFTARKEGREYRLMGNGKVMVEGVGGGFFRVPLHPTDNGKIYEQVDGVVNLVAKMLRSKELTNDEKFLYSCILAPEYFCQAKVLNDYRDFGVLLQSTTGAFNNAGEWLVMIDKKVDEYELMVIAEQQKKEQDQKKLDEIRAKKHVNDEVSTEA